MADALAEEQLRIYEEQASERDSYWMSDWQYIGSYFLPNESDINVEKTEGIAGWTQRIYDTTPIQAAQVLAAGQFNWLTPNSQPWAEYAPPAHFKIKDEDSDDIAAWFAQCSYIAMSELARSNFYSIMNLNYLGVGVFGTDLVMCEEGKKTALTFKHSKIGTYTISEDDEGVVDSVRRKFKLTGRQAKQMFGEDNLPKKMLDAMKKGKGMDEKYEFVHSCFPREESSRVTGKMDGKNKAYASVYIALEYRECVRVSGYDEMPYLCSRFAKWGTGSVWGYGPAYLSMPDARQINYMVQYLDSLAELHAMPRFLYPSNLEGDVDLRAGGITTFDPMVQNGMPKEWATVGEYKLGMELVQTKRDNINEAFFVPAFKMLGSDPLLDKKMTAYEISQRQGEKLEQFTPPFARRVTEFINPLMLRVFGILYRQQKFPPAPQSLMVKTGNNKMGLVLPEVLVTSRISLALKALQNRGTEEMSQFILPWMQFKPEMADNFDWDKLARNYSRNTGQSEDILLPMKDVEKLRAQRAKLQQQQRALAAAEQMGKAGAGLGKSPQFMQDQAQQGMQAALGN